MSHIPHQNPDEAALPRYLVPVSKQVFPILAGIIDIAAIIAVSLMSGAVYHYFLYGDTGNHADFIKVGAMVALFFVLPNIFRHRYSTNGFLFLNKPYISLFYIWNFAFFCVLAVGFMGKFSDIYSRGSVLVFYVFGFVAVVAIQRVVSRLIIEGWHTGQLACRRVLLVGTAEKINEFQNRYNLSNLGLSIKGTAPLSSGTPAGRGCGTQLAELDFAAARSRALNIDDVFILVPWSEKETIENCLETFMALPVSIHLGPERIFERFRGIRIETLGPLASLNLTRPPLKPMETLLKRAMDIILAGFGLVLLAPLFALVAMLIKLDSGGPVFFIQKRHGFNHELFNIFKFRTMYADDEKAAPVQAMKEDARITRVGRFLRRSNIDELPQLLNVLRGEMSIVGPRPHALVHNMEFERKVRLYARRHNMKPGITGWAQINGLRGPTETDDKIRTRVQYDFYYIDNWSIWFDIYIVIATLFSRKSYRNAF